MANPGDTPRIDDIESSLPVKYQKKQVQALTTTTGLLGDLAFQNLEIGKTYKLTFQLFGQWLSAGAQTLARVKIEFATAPFNLIQQVAINIADNNGTTEVQSTAVAIFEAESTQINFNADLGWNSNVRILGDTFAGANATYAILEELPNHVETTDWT